jgi:hypothetical protein
MSVCPTEYYNNCTNNLLCPFCTVHGGDIPLYSPIQDIGPHPIEPVSIAKDSARLKSAAKRDGRRAQRLGTAAERDIFTRLNGTHNVTSQGYDGTIRGYRVEYKVRLKGGSVLPTRAEYQKAVEQGNKLIIVEDKVSGMSTVTMSIETFEALVYDE